MLKFALLLRTVYSLTRNGHLDSMSVLNALLSKEPYHQLCLLLLNRPLEFNVNLVESLLKFVDVNYQNEAGWTLLHHSAYQKDCLLMQTCIKNNANLMIADRNGNSSLHIAIQVAQKRKNNSPLQFTDTLDNQIPIIINNEKEEDKIEYLKIVELILNSVHSTNKNGTETIKSTNKLNKEQQQVSYLNDNDENNQINRLLEPINNDEQQQNQPNLEILINKQNRFGKTALHYAVFLRPDQFSIKLITILLQNKANPNIFDYRNRTPLFYLLAEHQNQHQIAEKNEQKKSINSLNDDDDNKIENHSNNNCDFKNRHQQIKHCSKNCKLRSPFIDLLIKTEYYKCDRLNLDNTLKQYCRKAIQKYLNFNSNSITTINDNNDLGNNINSSAKNLQILLQINNNNMNYKLPISLCNYLSRRTL